jgi:magnesium transporter
MLFAGDGFAVSVRHGAMTSLERVRARLEDDRERLQHGAVGVLHAIVDMIVDEYQPVVDGLQEDIDQVEEGLFQGDGNGSTRRIYALGREVIEFSRATGPLVEPVRRMARGDIPGTDDELMRYFRDVLDHVERIDSWVSAQRELLSNLLQANLTQVTIEQNQDMRKISAWVAIVAVPTAIAGIYGMNFEDMPELKWALGYPAVLVVIAIICAFLWTRFKRAGWL